MKKMVSIGKVVSLVVVLMFGLVLFGIQSRESFNENDSVRTIKNKIEAMRVEGQKRGYTFEIGFNSAMQYSLDQLCTFNPELADPDTYIYERNECDLYSPMALPTSYLGYYTPIKDQGNCGSCWAFSMTAEAETTALKLTGITYDFSEQYVLNCTSSTWGCNGGFFNFVTFISPQGARAESCLPYTAKKSRCKQTCPIIYQITNWAYVGNSSSVPSVDSIKNAIYTYGAVSAAVYVDSYWQAYTSGCFNGTASGSCNHAIQLVGWDDSQCGGAGAWRLKNSWNTGWGEAGFMWIKYGSQLVGYAACYSY
jgi:C1A family cysteine protease